MMFLNNTAKDTFYGVVSTTDKKHGHCTVLTNVLIIKAQFMRVFYLLMRGFTIIDKDSLLKYINWLPCTVQQSHEGP